MEALLAYWLSWFVLPSGLQDGQNAYVFPLAILLVKGEVGSGSIVLRVFYAWLVECMESTLGGRYDVVTHEDSSFPQMFIWERSYCGNR